jgi:mevalonate kinase
MPAISATAPGKIILLGEHAVVYGSRAIAIPVNQVRARAAIFPLIHAEPGTIQIIAANIHLNRMMDQLPVDSPVRKAVSLTLSELHLLRPPAMQIRISSSIPIAGGMGSGAAVSIAIIRAVSTFLGKPLAVEQISRLAFEVEKLHHGTPSGIDNTVIAYESPILFQKEQGIQPVYVGKDLTFVVGSTAIRSSTRQVVQSVREARQKDIDKYDEVFKQIDQLVGQAFSSLQAGDEEMLGRWMVENHTLLQQIQVSCPELDHLVEAASVSGAYGAKLTGAGKGGNVIALVPTDLTENVQQQLILAGAKQTWVTTLKAKL